MAVPDFQTVMRPVLVALEDGEPHSPTAIRSVVANHFSLTTEDLEKEIPSGRAKSFQNRVGWALTYLFRSGLISRPKRSTYRLTERGKKVLADHPKRVDLKVLSQFDEFKEFTQSKSTDSKTPIAKPEATGDQTPEEQIDHAYGELQAALAAEVLDRVQEKSPDFFEQLVLDVLHAMGYGGTGGTSVQHLGKSGDEGVDGVIREDELGLDLIYVQAKRWTNPVGRPEIQKFFGALHGQGANKGVFITTSAFTADAVTYAESVTPRVVLVDGKDLARLMVNHGVGVTVARLY
jgi:restriction system protein